jgi:hypothetical protein
VEAVISSGIFGGRKFESSFEPEMELGQVKNASDRFKAVTSSAAIVKESIFTTMRRQGWCKNR